MFIHSVVSVVSYSMVHSQYSQSLKFSLDIGVDSSGGRIVGICMLCLCGDRYFGFFEESLVGTECKY